jgi:hypothetical protein
MTDFSLPEQEPVAVGKDYKNRQDPPGLKINLKPLDATFARQLIGHTVESTAVHSKSKGWLPRVMLTMQHVPLIGPGDRATTQLMLDPDEALQLVEILLEGVEAAERDAKYGLREM